MPLYDWKCVDCGSVFEEVGGMDQFVTACQKCDGKWAEKQFSPNKNILIPGHFRVDRGWHLSPDSQGGDASLNSRVRPQPKASFKQEFDKNWKAIGGA